MIIGSTHYFQKIQEHKRELEKQGYEVIIPAFDDHENLDDFGVCEYNRLKMLEADEVHCIWDQRSMGTIFDFGMAFAMQKPFKVIFLEPKTLGGVMEKYEKWTKKNSRN